MFRNLISSIAHDSTFNPKFPKGRIHDMAPSNQLMYVSFLLICYTRKQVLTRQFEQILPQGVENNQTEQNSISEHQNKNNLRLPISSIIRNDITKYSKTPKRLSSHERI